MNKKPSPMKDGAHGEPEYLLVPLWNEGQAGSKEVPRYEVVALEEANIPSAIPNVHGETSPAPGVRFHPKGKKRKSARRSGRELSTGLAGILMFPVYSWRSIVSLAFLLGIFLCAARAVLVIPNADLLPGKLILAFLLTLGSAAFCCGYWMVVLATTVRGEDSVALWHGGGRREVFVHMLRCLVCFFAGPAVILGVAYYYWLNCGDLKLVDQLILAELILAALTYWMFANLAVTADKSVLGVAPTKIIGLLRRLGWRTSLIATLAVLLGIPLIVGAGAYSLANLPESGWSWLLFLTSCIGWQVFLALLSRWLGVKCFLSDRARVNREKVQLDG